jgi:hypothetical protein
MLILRPIARKTEIKNKVMVGRLCAKAVRSIAATGGSPSKPACSHCLRRQVGLVILSEIILWDSSLYRITTPKLSRSAAQSQIDIQTFSSHIKQAYLRTHQELLRCTTLDKVRKVQIPESHRTSILTGCLDQLHTPWATEE